MTGNAELDLVIIFVGLFLGLVVLPGLAIGLGLAAGEREEKKHKDTE